MTTLRLQILTLSLFALLPFSLLYGLPFLEYALCNCPPIISALSLPFLSFITSSKTIVTQHAPLRHLMCCTKRLCECDVRVFPLKRADICMFPDSTRRTSADGLLCRATHRSLTTWPSSSLADQQKCLKDQFPTAVFSSPALTRTISQSNQTLIVLTAGPPGSIVS